MALGGAQEQHRVDLGDVEAFVEQIHREEDLQLAGSQAADLLGALVAGAGGIEGGGAQAGGHELAGHPVGMLHAHAEAQGPHRFQMGDLGGQFAQDQAQAGVVGGVEVGEGLGGVAVAAPFDLGEIGAVVEAEVVEGAQQALGLYLWVEMPTTLGGNHGWGAPLTTIEITLPDALAAEASGAGLLAPEAIERLLRDKLASDRIVRLQDARAALAADPPEVLTRQEINEEISAYRKGQRLAAGS